MIPDFAQEQLDWKLNGAYPFAVHRDPPVFIPRPTRCCLWQRIYNFILKLLFLPGLTISKFDAAETKRNFFRVQRHLIAPLPILGVVYSSNFWKSAKEYLNDEDQLNLLELNLTNEILTTYKERFSDRFIDILESPQTTIQEHWKMIQEVLSKNDEGREFHSWLRRNLIIAGTPRQTPRHIDESGQKRVQSILESRFKNIKLPSSDDAILDGISIINDKQSVLPPNKQRWMLFFLGNKAIYEGQLFQLRAFCNRLGINVICVNYRGVGESTGIPKSRPHDPENEDHDLYDDGRAVVSYLKSLGVQTGRMFAYGYSQGAAIAAKVAAENQEVGQEMMLCVDRAFKTYRKAAEELVADRFGRIMARIVGVIVTKLGWNFDTLASYQRVRGHKFILEHPEDGMVRKKARIGRTVLKLWKRSQRQNVHYPKPIVIKISEIDPYTKGFWLLSQREFGAHQVSPVNNTDFLPAFEQLFKHLEAIFKLQDEPFQKEG